VAFLHVTPAILSLVILCAHLFRNGPFLALPLVLVSFPLLLIPRGWVARYLQFVLLIAALEWGRYALFLAIEREEAGQPWLRAVIILASVALFTLFSAALFETRTLLHAYPRRYHDD